MTKILSINSFLTRNNILRDLLTSVVFMNCFEYLLWKFLIIGKPPKALFWFFIFVLYGWIQTVE